MSITYRTKYVLNQQKRFFWAPETSVAGTSPAQASVTWNLEPGEVGTNLIRAYYEAREPVGLPIADPIDMIEVTHWTEITVTTPYRTTGFVAYAGASLMGDVTACGSSDAVTGAGDPYTHTIVAGTKAARCNTFAIVHDTGFATSAQGDNSLLMTYCTVSSVRLQYDSNSVLMGTVSLTGSFPGSAYATAIQSQTPGIVSCPSAATAVVPGTRTQGWAGTFNLYQNASSTPYIEAGVITRGDLTIQRAVKPFYTVSQPSASTNPLIAANPYDFQSAGLSFTSNWTILFQGVQGASVFQDFLLDQKSGSSGNVNGIKFSDANSPSHSIEFDFYPAKWQGVRITDGQDTRELTGTLKSYQDYTQATANTPTLTNLQQMVIKSPNSSSAKYIN